VRLSDCFAIVSREGFDNVTAAGGAVTLAQSMMPPKETFAAFLNTS
jgi:hypothetical protein